MAEAVTSLEKADVKRRRRRPKKRRSARCATSSLASTNRCTRRNGRSPRPNSIAARGDQAKNRGTTESLEATSARLGDVGVALRKDLIRASASMRSAEQGLAKTAAGQAADDQSAALDVLVKSRDDFAPVHRAAARRASRRASDPADR